MPGVPPPIVIPAMYAGPRPRGGLRFRAAGSRRAAAAILPSIPGRLVHAGVEGGTLACKGWAWIDDVKDAQDTLFDMLIWIARAEYHFDCPDLMELAAEGEDAS